MRYLCERKVCKRRGGKGCLQRAIGADCNGKAYCYYHNPKKPHKFGEGHPAVTAAEAGGK